MGERLVKDKYIAQAQTEKEAIMKGLNALGITEEEAIINIEQPAKKGFLGIGQQDAVVLVERREKIDVMDEILANEISDINISSNKRTERKVVQREEHQEEVKEAVTPKKEVEVVATPKSVDEKTVEVTEEAAAEENELTESEIKEIDQKAIDEVNRYLKDVILKMDISDVEVYTSRVDNRVKYDIETENAGLVIGRHGKVLNGLQTLAQNHMHQLAHSKINVRVDAEKYRERRKNTVENLAERTADKVIKTQRPVKLDPMPAHERKQIHRQLNKNSKVKTHSEGRDPKRYLVVEPNE